jgi:hypothetical protein
MCNAVGMAVKGHDRSVCEQYCKEIVSKRTTSSYHRFHMPFGQYSNGDVDTIAAIAGALVGIRTGLSGIPSVWYKRLEDLGEYKFQELCDLVMRAMF